MVEDWRPKPQTAAMRPIWICLLLAGCSQAPEEIDRSWSDGRDGLCLAGRDGSLRAGLIVYGEGDSNCSLSGQARQSGDQLVITPRGDSSCRVQVEFGADGARIGRREAGCSYYCGPGADFSGRLLPSSDEDSTAVRDFGGDPLC